jgi:hypothetical protein
MLHFYVSNSLLFKSAGGLKMYHVYVMLFEGD